MKLIEAENYREYLRTRLDEQGPRSGLRAAAAKAIGVHSTYLSQILSGAADLSIEQAELCNDFLDHNAGDADYFSLLVCRDRAKSPKSKMRFDQMLKARRTEQLTPKKVIRPATELSAEDALEFYSNFIYTALYVLCSIPEFASKRNLARALRLDPLTLSPKIDFLLRSGILKKSKEGLKVGPRHLHLGHDKRMIRSHHTSWRLHAIQSLNEMSERDLHYSACVSLSKRVADQIKLSILENLKKNQDIIANANEEEVWVYNFDFYPLLR